jgi:histidine triad (HIT) family protein
MEGCIFCKIIRGEIPCIKIYEDDTILAFADINPIRDGHTLIIPKRHAENIFEITEAELNSIIGMAKRISHAIQKALNAEGIAVLQLNGKAVNQVVMHYHLHLIPQPPGASELTMTAWKLIPGDMAGIKANAGKIAAALT